MCFKRICTDQMHEQILLIQEMARDAAWDILHTISQYGNSAFKYWAKISSPCHHSNVFFSHKWCMNFEPRIKVWSKFPAMAVSFTVHETALRLTLCHITDSESPGGSALKYRKLSVHSTCCLDLKGACLTLYAGLITALNEIQQ